MKLNNLQIKNADHRDKAYKLSDGRGLFVLIHTNGSKYWQMKYRFGGKEKLLSIGVYPEVSLAEARQRCTTARAQIRDGLDPGQQKQLAKLEAQLATENTFRSVANQYLEKQQREGRAPTTITKNRWLLDMACDGFGNMPVADIKPPIILKVLKRVEAKGTHETAHRLRTVIGSVFRYAGASGLVDNDPTAVLKGALVRTKVTARAAITDPDKLGGLLRAIDGFQGQAITRYALQLIVLLFPRPGELRMARWDEFDLEEQVWTIPAERTKMRRVHRVPLPEKAISLLRELQEVTGFGELVFPSVRSVKRPISDNTLNAALRRMGYASDEMTAHGFRATFATIANESGLWHPDAIERALAHLESNEIRRAYTRGEHWDERARMANWWAGELEQYRNKIKSEG